MDNSTLINNLLSTVAGFNDLLPVYWPNVGDGANPPEEAHIRVDVLMAKTDTIGIKSLSKKQGILQFRVFYPKGYGLVKPATEADKILAHFPRGLSVSGIRFDEEGYISPPIEDEDWHVTPVTVTFNKLES